MVPAVVSGTSISIHAPRGGSDYLRGEFFFENLYFNPRSPWGERPDVDIITVTDSDFNPRSPWGERPSLDSNRSWKFSFQSTLPVGGATNP